MRGGEMISAIASGAFHGLIVGALAGYILSALKYGTWTPWR